MQQLEGEFCYDHRTMSGLFLSDLHLFSRRSIGQRYWEQHRDAVARRNPLYLAAISLIFGGVRWGISMPRWRRQQRGLMRPLPSIHRLPGCICSEITIVTLECSSC